jgi:hypothetical protein
MPKSLPDPGRRRLLARTRNTAAAPAALAVLGPIAPASAAAHLPEPAAPEPASRGYRESEHTRRYYQLARY